MKSADLSVDLPSVNTVDESALKKELLTTDEEGEYLPRPPSITASTVPFDAKPMPVDDADEDNKCVICEAEVEAGQFDEHTELHNRHNKHYTCISGCIELWYATEEELVAHNNQVHDEEEGEKESSMSPTPPMSASAVKRPSKKVNDSPLTAGLACKYCNRGFPNDDRLASHLKTHYERPYMCPFRCRQSSWYATYNGVRQHAVRAHCENIDERSTRKAAEGVMADAKEGEKEVDEGEKEVDEDGDVQANGEVEEESETIDAPVEAKKTFPCDEAGCDRIFATFHNVIRHKRTTHGAERPAGKSNECAICGAFNSQRHSRTHEPKEFQCKQGCPQLYYSSSRALNCHHSRYHPAVRLLPAKEVDVRPPPPPRPSGGHKCDVCGKSCAGPKRLEDHKQFHVPTPFQCKSGCTNIFYTEERQLKSHITKKHLSQTSSKSEAESSTACAITPKALDDATSVTANEVCAVCEEGIPSDVTMADHLTVHDPKPFLCVFGCVRAFFDTTASLNAHIGRSHPNHRGKTSAVVDKRDEVEEGYKESIGDRSTEDDSGSSGRPRTVYEMRKQMKTKREASPPIEFRCMEGCDRTFTRRSDLSKHQTRHHHPSTAAKRTSPSKTPWACQREGCKELVFTSEKQLEAHNRVMHVDRSDTPVSSRSTEAPAADSEEPPKKMIKKSTVVSKVKKERDTGDRLKTMAERIASALPADIQQVLIELQAHLVGGGDGIDRRLCRLYLIIGRLLVSIPHIDDPQTLNERIVLLARCAQSTDCNPLLTAHCIVTAVRHTKLLLPALCLSLCRMAIRMDGVPDGDGSMVESTFASLILSRPAHPPVDEHNVRSAIEITNVCGASMRELVEGEPRSYCNSCTQTYHPSHKTMICTLCARGIIL